MEPNEHDHAIFEQVLRHLRREVIPPFASDVRRFGHKFIKSRDEEADTVECKVLEKIDHGSYHAVLTLSFTDGVEWVLKVPAKGHTLAWTDEAAQALSSEAQTMRLIRRETSVSVPAVYAFNATIQNELGCPFILMEKMRGLPVDQGWFNDEVSLAKRK